MRYYIDGNNLAGVLFRRAKGERDRERALNFLLGKKKPKLMTVAFDGFSFGKSAPSGALQVIFSGNRKADEMILSKFKKGDTVVTNDLGLQHSVKTRGGKVMSVREFLEKIEPNTTQSEKPPSENEIEKWMEIFKKGKDGS